MRRSEQRERELRRLDEREQVPELRRSDEREQELRRLDERERELRAGVVCP